MKSNEDYIDEEIGWRIQEERDDVGVTYIYTNQKTGDVIKGSALESYYQSPRIRILSCEKEQQEIKKLRAAGVLCEQIARRIMNMVHKLHKDGYESLYLDSVMAPSGGYWRYDIGAMEQGGLWPNRGCEHAEINDYCVRGSIGGGFDQKIPWGTVTDSLDMLTAKFIAAYPKMVNAACQQNFEYVKWYREMLERTEPEGMLIFACDGSHSYHTYAFTWGPPRDFQMPMPPGYRKRNT